MKFSDYLLQNLEESYELITECEEALDESFASNQAHSLKLKYMGFGHWGDGQHSTHVSHGGKLVKLDAPLKMERNVKGSLAHMPGSWIKRLASGWSSRGVGDQSKMTVAHSSEIKSPSALGKVVNDSMNSTHEYGHAGAHVASIVHVNGHPVAMLHKKNSYSSRPEYGVQTHDGKDSTVKVAHQPSMQRRRRGDYKVHYTENPSLSKGEASSAITRALYAHTGQPIDKDFFKTHSVEVHHIHADSERTRERAERMANKPEMQNNRELGGAVADDANSYHSNKQNKVVSSTPAGDMQDITRAAAKKLVTKKLGGEAFSKTAKGQLDDLHKQLGDAIASQKQGAHRTIAHLAQKIADHALTHGNSATSEAEDISSSLGEAKPNSHARRSALERLRSKMGKKD